MTYKTCIITKLLIPPHNTYPLPLDSSTKNLKFVIPLSLIQNIVYLLANPPPLHFEKTPFFINFAL